ncbi:hypothetical protein PQI07_32200 [Methylobacterium sp. 092160098-2]|uniref:hypothetical protein n=1 Tax=Methylobacterium sp. 092160098-2 TaxID=3025129 RepID=UPI002381C3B7|nr:hypothetical protein [Methylobacterium sp. 092160098-2]MDE4915249.1 hypothetical protein [Methylobacterium sp. 092160098-2]
MSFTARSPARTRHFTAAKLLPVVFAGLAFTSTVLTSAAQARPVNGGTSEVPAVAQLVHLPMLHVGTGFRRVSAVGQTKPAGAALDERAGSTAALDARSRQLDWLINNAICTGC